MKAASLKLCKKLYELSEWGQTYKAWAIPAPSMSRAIPTVVDNKPFNGPQENEPGSICPAYDLGYLLRKLPKYWNVEGKEIHLGYNIKTNYWYCGFSEGKQLFDWYYEGNTPEDACAKLAIELFKQGILK